MSEAGAPPRYTAAGAALHGLLKEIARLPIDRLSGALRGREALLVSLLGRPPATAAALAREGRLPAATRQGVQRLADGLRDEGLLERVPNPRHRRAPRLALTEAGRRRAVALLHEEARRLNDRAAGLDPEALRSAARLLRAVRSTGVPG